MIAVAAATAGAGILQYLTQVFNSRELGKRRPTSLRNAGRNANKLYKGYEQRVDDIGSGRKPEPVGLDKRVPKEDLNIFDPRNQLSDYASNAVKTSSEPAQVWINPNADEAYLAHELGHLASNHTDIGQTVRSLRDNPKLGTALFGAMMTVPGFAAAVEAGDNDMDTSMALALAASAPTLVDEALATKNGLAIMNNAGRRASLGQRGKMAAGYLSYLAAPILAATAGNTVGNMLDSDY